MLKFIHNLHETIVSKINQNPKAAPALYAAVAIVAIAIFYQLFFANNKKKNNNKGENNNASKMITATPDGINTNVDYDVVVCGGSISGTAASIQFAKQGRRVLVVEKDLSKPDTIIGELMQPAGLAVLRQMGLEQCARNVGVPAHGYAAMMDGDWVDLPFESNADGVSFHHGDFVTELRRAMLKANELPEVKKSGGRLTVIEGVVDQLVFDSKDLDLVRGVSYRERVSTNTLDFSKERKTVIAKLVVCCDGAYSVLRPDNPLTKDPHSHFVGMAIRHVNLKYEQRGNVILGRKGIILSYRLDPNEVRFLIDYGVPGPLPSRPQLIKWLRNDMIPELPEHLKEPFEKELQRAEANPDNNTIIRSRPHYHFTPVFPKYRGMVGVGDHGNMRHPLTGAGMSCALRDSYYLTKSLESIPDLADRRAVQAAIRTFVTSRPTFTSVLNVLSWALYGVFTGPLAIRQAVMEYFHEGGDAVRIPLAMLAGIESRFHILLFHYICTMISGAKFLIAGPKGRRSFFRAITFFVNPFRLVQALFFVFYATYLFGSVCWKEFITPWRLIDRASSWIK